MPKQTSGPDKELCYYTAEEREAAIGTRYLGQQGWSLFIRESVTQTLERLFGGRRISRKDMLLIREAIAIELDRQAHRFKSRTSLLAPNNVAYHLERRAEAIRNGEA